MRCKINTRISGRNETAPARTKTDSFLFRPFSRSLDDWSTSKLDLSKATLVLNVRIFKYNLYSFLNISKNSFCHKFEDLYLRLVQTVFSFVQFYLILKNRE